jgi:hypothetical protein
MTLLHDEFGNRIINAFGHHGHPILHLLITACGGGRGEEIKGAIYKDSPHTLLKLKEANVNFITDISLQRDKKCRCMSTSM